MPAEYSTTARALALSASPPQSPSITRPQWRRSRSSSSRPTSSVGARGQLSQLWHRFGEIQRQTIKIYEKMPLWQKILAGLAYIICTIVGLLFMIYNQKIFEWLAPVAVSWRQINGGWLILWALIFVTAFPPIIGYATLVTIAGFVYGFPNGWFIAASASVVGSVCSIIVSRTVLAGYVHRLVANDKRFTALALTLKHDGMKLLCMIRLCPLPYSLSNGAMSTFPTVNPLMYGLATAIASLKLFLPVFIGGRLADLGERGGKMDAGTKAINYLGIALSAVLGIGIGWFIYKRTLSRAAQLEAEERRQLQSANDEAIGSFSDEDVEYSSDAVDHGDDISLFETTSPDEAYRDEAYRDDDSGDEDDDGDVFAYGDSDVERTAGLDKEGRRTNS